MADLDALLHAVCLCPDDDLPRLLFADAVEDYDAERAEFIRIGVQLARMACSMCVGKPCVKCDELRRRERELLTKIGQPWPLDGAALREQWGYLPADSEGILRRVDWRYSRGFINTIRLPWTSFLLISPSLLAGGMVECPKRCEHSRRRNEQIYHMSIDGVSNWLTCPCTHTATPGKVARPFAATMQPVQVVNLTTWPRERPMQDVYSRITVSDETNHTVTHVFDRILCEKCKGERVTTSTNPNRTYDTCPACHGQPQNLWRCEVWARVVFVMP